MKEYDFEVKERGDGAHYADKLIEFAAEIDNVTLDLPNYSVDHVNVRYGYIAFEQFDYNYNKVFRIGLEYGLAVSAVYDPETHDGEIILSFKPLNTETVEREVVKTIEKTIEEEQYAFDY